MMNRLSPVRFGEIHVLTPEQHRIAESKRTDRIAFVEYLKNLTGDDAPERTFQWLYGELPDKQGAFITNGADADWSEYHEFVAAKKAQVETLPETEELLNDYVFHAVMDGKRIHWMA